MDYDLVIRNGLIVDGTGSAPFGGDVGVKDGVITAVGKVEGSATREFDADGTVVSPGFIDVHTHMDAQVFWDPMGTSACYHGVTTAVMGHCGFTLAPVHNDSRELVVRNLERAEDISPEALAVGVPWSWQTFPEYMEALAKTPMGINYAVNIGHSALRTYAMGERAFSEAHATEDEFKIMENELRQAMAAGAMGFTTSRSETHSLLDGQPVASRIADWSEVSRLVHVMSELGGGLFQLAPQGLWYSEDDEERSMAWKELWELAVSSKIPMMFGLPATGTTWQERLDYLDKAAEAGGKMVGITRCRGLTGVLGFKTRLPYDALPEWQPIRALPFDEQMKALRDPAVREKLVYAANHGTYPPGLGGAPKRPDYDLMRVFEQAIAPNPTINEAARARGVDPVDFLIDLALESNFEQLLFQPNQPPDFVAQEAVMRHPKTVMSFSDSGAHVTYIADSSLQTYMLAVWVRDRKTFTIEEAVQMMTQREAQAWGFNDRGVIQEGMKADLNVFDPDTIMPDVPLVKFDLPAGARRYTQTATGFLASFVGGEMIFENGEATGALPGTLLKGPLATDAA